ncbi:MAG: hypothetical protein ACRC4J_01080, partial [Cetobacterium sp.]
RVFAPLGAPSGVTNRTTITPNLTQGTYSTTPTVTAAFDDTTVLAEKLNITKFQRLNASEGWVTTLQKANPGDIIHYRIDVKNSGTDQARTVQLKDNIPFYTTIIYGSVDGYPVTPLPKYEIYNAAGAVVGGAEITKKPAVGEKGEIIVDLDTLEPGHTVRMLFHVKINNVTSTGVDEK